MLLKICEIKQENTYARVSFLKEIQHNMSMALFHIWFILRLYYKMLHKFITKNDSYLLQNATEVYYKMCEVFYYKMWHL